MAGDAFGPQAGELADRRAGMAGAAFHSGVRADEREPVLMVLDRLDGDVPPLDRVALLALRSELAAVQIGVAIRALCPHVAEHQLDVAGHAVHFLVHSTQGVGGLVVIEFGLSADGFPARERVATVAGLAERSVRIARRALPGRLRPTRRRGHREQRNKDQELDNRPWQQVSPPQDLDL